MKSWKKLNKNIEKVYNERREGRVEGEKIGEKRGEKRGEKIGLAKAIKQMVKEYSLGLKNFPRLLLVDVILAISIKFNKTKEEGSFIKWNEIKKMELL